MKKWVTLFLICFAISALAEEYTLRLLVWEGYAPKKYIAEFEKEMLQKYRKKVKLKISFVAGSDDFYDPIRNKSFDVVTPSQHHFKDKRFKFIANGLLLPLNLKNIPNYKNVIPSLRKADCLTDNRKAYGIPVAQGPYGLAYNTGKFKEVPKSWNALWQPENKGKYVLSKEEYIYNAAITALALDYPRKSICSYDALNNDKFKKKLRELTVNAHCFWIGQDSAEALFGHKLATVWGDSISDLKKKGEIWKIAKPKEGTMFWVDNYAITWTLKEKPFLKKIAEEWINKTLSPEFQGDNILRHLTIYPIVTNIPGKLTAEESERVYKRETDVKKDNHIPMPTLTQRDRNGIKLLWEEALKGIPEKERHKK